MGSFENCCATIYALGLITINIAFMVYHFPGKNYSLASLEPYFKQILSSTQGTSFYMDLVYAQTCPIQYERVMLGSWPGTLQACSCSNSVYAGPCKASDSSCTTVNSLDGQGYYSWKDQGYSFCAKKAIEGTDYIFTFNNCEPNQIECWPGFCFLNNACPVTNITLNGTGSIITQALPLKNPLIGVGVSYFEAPCFRSDELSTPSSFFEILNIKRGQYCSNNLTDRTVSVLDRADEYTLIQSNSLTTRVQSIQSYQSESQNVPVLFYQKNALKIKNETHCKNFDKSWLTQSSILTGLIDRSVSVTTILTFAFVGFFIIAIIFALCSGSNSDLKDFAPGFNVIFLEWLVATPVIIIAAVQMRNGTNDLRDSLSCFDDPNVADADDLFVNIVQGAFTHLIGFSVSMFILAAIGFCSLGDQKLLNNSDQWTCDDFCC